MAENACLCYAFFSYASRSKLAKSAITHAECRIPEKFKRLYYDETLVDGHYTGQLHNLPRNLTKYCSKCGSPCFYIRLDCPDLRAQKTNFTLEEIPEFLRNKASQHQQPSAAATRLGSWAQAAVPTLQSSPLNLVISPQFEETPVEQSNEPPALVEQSSAPPSTVIQQQAPSLTAQLLQTPVATPTPAPRRHPAVPVTKWHMPVWYNSATDASSSTSNRPENAAETPRSEQKVDIPILTQEVALKKKTGWVVSSVDTRLVAAQAATHGITTGSTTDNEHRVSSMKLVRQPPESRPNTPTQQAEGGQLAPTLNEATTSHLSPKASIPPAVNANPIRVSPPAESPPESLQKRLDRLRAALHFGDSELERSNKRKRGRPSYRTHENNENEDNTGIGSSRVRM